MIDWDAHVIGPLVDVFGEQATYTLQFGPSFSVNVVFDEAFQEVDLTAGTGITSVMPVAGVRLSEFPVGWDPENAQGDEIYINSRAASYLIKEGRSDGHGWAKLLLKYKG